MMPSELIQNVISSLTDEKEWPDNVVLYKSLEEQELLPEVAKCNSIQALFTVHGLQDQYSINRRHNSEHMAPQKGQTPFLRIQNNVISGENVLDFLRKRNYTLNNDLSPKQELLVNGILSLIQTKLLPIELYAVWIDEKNVIKTCESYGYKQPPPLKQILCYEKWSEIKNYLHETGWLKKTERLVYAELDNIFQFLSHKLECHKYIAGNELSEADVFVFGHLQAIIESKLPNNILLTTLEQYPKLSNFCLNFSHGHLGKEAMLWEFI